MIQLYFADCVYLIQLITQPKVVLWRCLQPTDIWFRLRLDWPPSAAEQRNLPLDRVSIQEKSRHCLLPTDISTFSTQVKKKKKKKPFSSVKSWECPLVPYCPIVFQGKLLHMIVLFYRNVLSQRNSRDCELTILPISERRMRTIRGHSDKAMSTQVNSCLLMNMRQRTIYLPWNYHKSQTNEKKRKNEQKSVTLLVINPTAMWPIILIGLIIFLENTSINRVGPPLWYHIPNKTQLPLKKK